MTILIDDFKTGPHDITILSGVDLSYQTGSMLGGGRFTQLIVAQNPQNQPAHLDITKGYLNLSLGAMQYLRVELGYPYEPDGSGGGRTLSFIDQGMGDFSSMGSAFRTSFRSSDLMLINYNIVAYTAGGWAAYGENISAPPFTRSHFDFPFEKFIGPGTPDFSKVSIVVFIFQTFADFVIDSFEIV
jgi:hypothetical protein